MLPRAPRRAFLVYGLVWCFRLAIPLGAVPAHAEDGHLGHPVGTPGTRELTLREALQEGAERAPLVRHAEAPRAALKEAERVSQPTLLLPPSLSAQLGPRSSSGSLSPELIVAVSQPLSLSGQGNAQAEVARRELQLVADDVRAQQAEAALSAGQAWIDLALSHRVLELRQAALAEVDRLVDLAEKRVRLGQAEPLELSVARSEWSSARALVLEAEGLHFSAAVGLALALGADSVALEARGGLEPAPEGAPASDQPESLTHKRLIAEQSAIEARAKLNRAYQAPWLSLGLQYQREGTGDQVLTGTLTVPLMTTRPGRFQEAQLRAEAERASEGARWAKVRASLELRRAEHELTHARAVWAMLAESALPEQKTALQIVTAKYELGSIDIARVAWHRQAVLNLEERVASALADVHRAWLTRLRATGTLLTEIGS